MAVSEVQETGITFTSGSSGLGGVTIGTWVWDNSTVAFSGGGAQRSTTAADSLTFAFTGRALYLVSASRSPNGGGGAGGEFTVTLDNDPLPGKFMCSNGSPFANISSTFYRVLIPIARGLTDGPHTVTITVVGGGTVWIDSFLVVTGNRINPVVGNLVCLGDSITNNGTGATSALLGFTNRLAGQMQGFLQRKINLVSKGVNGDRQYGIDSTKTGGMYRLFADVLAGGAFTNNPEFLTILFGVNDLSGTSGGTPAGDFVRHTTAMLEFIEDTMDVLNSTDSLRVKVALGTPTMIPAQAMMPSYPISTGGNYADPTDNWDAAVDGVRQIAAQFRWLYLAQIGETMADRFTTTFPNAQADYIHPNDSGHGIITTEFLRAFLGGLN